MLFDLILFNYCPAVLIHKLIGVCKIDSNKSSEFKWIKSKVFKLCFLKTRIAYLNDVIMTSLENLKALSFKFFSRICILVDNCNP